MLVLAMTAIAAALIAGTPTLVGDMILSDRDGNRTDYRATKLHVLAPNLALGWSGSALLAKPAVTRLSEALSTGSPVLKDDVATALDRLADLRNRPDDSLKLVGWLVTAEGPKVVRWASHYAPSTFSGNDVASIGDGGDELRAMLNEPEFGAQGTPSATTKRR